jgi:hypothetical protein
MTAQRTITLSADQWLAILDAVKCHCDEGPPGEGWKSPKLSAASAALSSALEQPKLEPEEPTDVELQELLYYEFTTGTGHGETSDPIGFARAVLARWGHVTQQGCTQLP